jgi:hypothetical protein
MVGPSGRFLNFCRERRFDLSGRRNRQHYLEAIQCIDNRLHARYQEHIGCNCELEFMIDLTPHRSLLAEPCHSVVIKSRRSQTV